MSDHRDGDTMVEMLRTEALEKCFVLHLRNGLRIPVLRDVGISVCAGECVALTGPSGAGKSTLLRSLYGNYRVDAGHIWIRHDGTMIDIAAAPPREVVRVRAGTLGYVSQFLRVVPRVASVDVVAEAARAIQNEAARADDREATRGMSRQSAGKLAEELLLRLNIPRRLHGLPPATFSGGEQQRVNLARGFIGGHPVLLLDEPTASLDAENRDIVVGMIREAKARGVAIVGIFHDTIVRDAVADRTHQVTPLQDAA